MAFVFFASSTSSFLFSYGAHRIAQSLRQLKHAPTVPSTPSDDTIARLVQSRGRPPPIHVFAHALSCALVGTAKKSFHVACLSGPSLAPNSRSCGRHSSHPTAVPRTHWMCRCRVRYHPQLPGGYAFNTPHGFKEPTRAGLQLGSPGKRASNYVHSSPWRAVFF